MFWILGAIGLLTALGVALTWSGSLPGPAGFGSDADSDAGWIDLIAGDVDGGSSD